MTSQLSIAEVEARLTAPGAPFEMAEIEALGRQVRVWKYAPPDIRTLFMATLAHGERDYLVYEDERLSYAAHGARVIRLAHVLVDRFGVRKGDRIALAMRNLPEWPVVFWASVCVGAVIVPLNAWWTGPELEFGITDSNARILFVDGERLERLRPLMAGLGVDAVIASRAANPGADVLDLEDLIAQAPAATALPDVTIDPDDDATIFYTSGTTGKPKGALGTHRNMCTNVVSLGFSFARAELRRGVTPAALSGETPPPSAALLSVPFFHATGCHSTLVSNSVAGNKLVLMHKWNPERALELIERERVAGFGGVPAMIWQIIASPDFATRDLSSVQRVTYGGAPAAPELVARIREAFPQAMPANGYGMTETSSVATINAAEDYQRKPDSVGRPVPVMDFRVVGLDGVDVAPGEIGEIWMKGPNVVREYWNRPEATASTITDGGWMHSGDLGRIDEEGFVFIVDRAKDMLIRAGENIYCVEVENALYTHPDIIDAAVIGLPDQILGEEVGAIVQLRPGAHVSESAIKAHVAQQIAAFKVPVSIQILPGELPRNANGKILKADLKRDFAGTRV